MKLYTKIKQRNGWGQVNINFRLTPNIIKVYLLFNFKSIFFCWASSLDFVALSISSVRNSSPTTRRVGSLPTSQLREIFRFAVFLGCSTLCLVVCVMHAGVGPESFTFLLLAWCVFVWSFLSRPSAPLSPELTMGWWVMVRRALPRNAWWDGDEHIVLTVVGDASICGSSST